MFLTLLLVLLAVFAAIGWGVGRRRASHGGGIAGLLVLGTGVAVALPLGVGVLYARIGENGDGQAVYAGFAAFVAGLVTLVAWSIGLGIGARRGRRNG